MTPDQLAGAITNEGWTVPEIERQIQLCVDAAVASEREACAKIAESFMRADGLTDCAPAMKIAAAIRRRA